MEGKATSVSQILLLERPRWLLEAIALLLVLLLHALLVLPYLDQELVLRDDWGHAQLIVYARNFLSHGVEATRGLPTFGFVGDRPIWYVNHPWATSWILAAWMRVTGAEVGAYRTLALGFSLAFVVAVWRLGRQVAGRRGALAAALVAALMPISQRMAVSYCMELANQVLMLAGLALLAEWTVRRTGPALWLAFAALALAQACDVYTLALVPLLLLAAWRWPGHRLALLGAAAVPILVQAVAVGYLAWVGALGESWRLGASRYARPWTLWSDPFFYQDLANRALAEFSLPVLVLAVLGVALVLRRPRGRCFAFALVWSALAFAVASAHGIHNHRYLIFVGSAPVAVLAGVAVACAPRRLGVAGVAALGTWLALTPVPYFEPAYPRDPVMAAAIRRLTTPDDLLVGLSPHMAVWVDRPAVPYSYFWDTTPRAAKERMVAERLQELIRQARPRRVILFTSFLHPDMQPVRVPRALDGMPGYRLTSRPDEEPLVWSRMQGG